ncbi:MAG: hypothetical protein E6G27_18390 [Actinobacteria bacterium]|nr:MAG: hypothetical protein E6G27_18390 [Actinomycetota bacterium]
MWPPELNPAHPRKSPPGWRKWCCEAPLPPSQEGTSGMNANSTRHVVVEPGGEQVAAHVGLHSLGRFADAMALGEALSAAIPTNGRVLLHDRGRVVLQTMLMLAGRGEACTDIEYLRAQPELFGEELLQAGFAAIRAKAWRRSKLTRGSDPVVLDIDSTLCEIHSENKENTAPTYKGGFGFHPMLCFADATGEALSGLLRPGNAGANDAEDHLAVLDAAIAALPPEIAAGHHEDDDGRGIAGRWWSGPTRPGPVPASSGAAGTDTSASRSRPARIPR